MREALEEFLEKSKLRLKIKRCQTREGDEEENCSRQWEQHVQRLIGKKASVRFINILSSLKSLDSGWVSFRPEFFLWPRRRPGLRELQWVFM